MPSALPDGEPAPTSGELPAAALARLGSAPFGVYVHVPFCTVRCGYCDFNTYTLTELGDGSVPGASLGTYASAALRELDLARRVLGDGVPDGRDGLRRRRHAHAAAGGRPRGGAARHTGPVRAVADGAEVTTEANPDSVTARVAAPSWPRAASPACRLGMQCAVPHVLRTLDRTHDPANVARAVGWARAAGLERQPRPHLRHAGGVAGRLAPQPRRGGRSRTRPRLRLRAGRRGGHPARGPGASRGGPAARGRRRGRQVRARRRRPDAPPATAGTR